MSPLRDVGNVHGMAVVRRKTEANRIRPVTIRKTVAFGSRITQVAAINKKRLGGQKRLGTSTALPCI
jgi:hypothetical protein